MHKNNTYKHITQNGLWKNNPALVQLLGLCPLLAVSNTIVNALGLGLATIGVLVISNTIVSLMRKQIPTQIRLPAFVMIIACATTCIELLMQAYAFELYEILGIFIPLIVTNCSVLGRADAFASKNPVGASALDGLMMGLGFTIVLLANGALRELLGQGSLFAGMELLLGDWATHLRLSLPETYKPFLFAILPPGAFITLGFLIALKQHIDHMHQQRAEQTKAPVASGHKRIRVTDHIQ